jgi:hypothetical protein
MFVGDADTESAVVRLKVKKIRYVKKRLQSSPKNWMQIARLIESSAIQAVAVKLVPGDMIRFSQPQYKDAGRTLLKALASKPHVLFMFEGLIGGVGVDYELPSEPWRRTSATKSECIALTEALSDAGISITPYKTLAELSLVVTGFIEDYEQNLIFRVYIPSDRLYAAEIDQVMDLFRDWMAKAAGVAVRRDGYSTQAGTVYEFYGDGAVTKSELPDLFAQFSSFLEMCTENQDDACELLETRGVSSASALEMVERYGRRGRRISMDMKHDFERKMLQLKQSLEAEVLDASFVSSSDGEAVIVPNGISPSSIVSSLTLNLNQNIVAAEGSIVHGIVMGTNGLSQNAIDVLQLIADRASDVGEDPAELANALHELEDVEAPYGRRVQGRQRLKSFIGRLAGHGEKIGVALVQKYIESKVL